MNNEQYNAETRQDTVSSTPDLTTESGDRTLFPNLKPQKQSKKSRDRMLLYCIGGVAVFFIILACMIGYSIRFQIKYREFVSALSNATTQAYEENGLFYLQEDGILHKVKRNKMHTVYKIMTMKKGIEVDSVPDTQPSLTFRYPHQALLEIWEVDPTITTSHKKVLRWRFTESSGKNWIFEGDFVSVILIMNSITKA